MTTNSERGSPTSVGNVLEIGTPRLGNLNNISLIPEFSGSTGQIKVEAFFYRINEIAQIDGWTELQKAIIARLKLVGDARDFVENNTELGEATFEELRDNLVAWFHIEESHSQAVAQFEQCVQKPGESVRQYATRIFITGNKTLILAGNDAEKRLRKKILGEAILNQFVKGLTGNVRRFVMSSNPHSYEDALKVALREECIEVAIANKSAKIHAIDNSRPSRNTNNNKKGTNSQGATMGTNSVGNQASIRQTEPSQTHVSTQPLTQPQRPQTHTTVTCFRCGGVGHYASFCGTPRELGLGSGNTQPQGNRANNNNTQQGMSTNRPRCTYCNKIGHLEQNCWSRGPGNVSPQNNSVQQQTQQEGQNQANGSLNTSGPTLTSRMLRQ